MENKIYAELNFKLDSMDEKTQKVLIAQQNLREAIAELNESVVDGLKVTIKK